MSAVADQPAASRVVRSEHLVPGYISLGILALPVVVAVVWWLTWGWKPALLATGSLIALGVLGNIAEWGVERMSAGRVLHSGPSAEK